MARLLFGVRPLDPLSFAGAALVLAVFAAVVCYVPRTAGTRVDPLTACGPTDDRTQTKKGAADGEPPAALSFD